MYIGNHLSASKGYAAMGRMAVKLGANTFAFFTRNPRGGAAKAIDPGGCGKAAGTDAGAAVWKTGGACTLHDESVRGEGGYPQVLQGDDRGRSVPDGVHAGELLQFSSGFPCRTGGGCRNRMDCGRHFNEVLHARSRRRRFS